MTIRTIGNKDEWLDEMKKRGADEFLQDTTENMNLDLIYAIKGTMLKGSWNTEVKSGVIYTGKSGLGISQFSKARRKMRKQ